MRSADERRKASSITSSSIRCASVGGQVGCTMKTSPPRTFSSIWKLNSPSEKRSAYAFPMSQLSWRQISSANLGFALPEKTLIPPVVLIAFQSEKIGWGGWIRTNECRFQRPVPYHLATPQYLFICLQ